MFFQIEDALAARDGTVIPLADEGYAAELLRRSVGRRAAARLLAEMGATQALKLSVADLVALGGVDERTAECVVAARDYAHVVITRKRVTAPNAAAVVDHLPSGFAVAEVEMLLAFALDGRMGVKCVVLVAKGGASAAAITPRDLFLPLVRLGAVAFILAHNHPSGSAEPSDADVVLTNLVMKIGVQLGIPLMDHIVVAATGVFSFQEHGLLLSDSEMESMLHEDAGLSGGAS